MLDRLRKRLRAPQERAGAAAGGDAPPSAAPELGFYGNELPDRGPQSGFGGASGY